MMSIIEIVNARRPDMVEQAAEKVLGVKTDLGDEEFNAILDKRAEAITHFDKYPDRVAEVCKLREYSVHNGVSPQYAEGRNDLLQQIKEILK